MRPYHMRARAVAAQATRNRILAAMLELFLKRWYDEITLKDVAAEAGVALQTVVNHFSTKEGLLSALLEDPRLIDEFAGRRFSAEPGDVAGALELLEADYEHAGDAMLRMLALEWRAPAIRPVLEIGRVGHRRWLEAIFETSLATLPARLRERRLDQLVCATDVYLWQILRRVQRRTRKETLRSVLEMVTAIQSMPITLEERL